MAKITWLGLLLCVSAVIAAVLGIYGFLQQHYVLAAIPPAFFVVVMLWLGRKWIEPEE